MIANPNPAAPRVRGAAARLLDEEYFQRQPSRRAELPDPEPLLANLSRCVVEAVAGARSLDQIARWVTDDVYRHLSKRVVLAARARRATGVSPRRPALTIGSVVVCEPADGIIEATVIVHDRVRTRAVAIRLEGLDRRWRASAIGIL
ncbi:Rv3235 family protein [Agromyces seonyuensis]|uniref:3-hydroxyacyl-CoA dehydrogenase n=1 Tax=Agromyces seonyuensis TaxID=2662446 RepID=A0A6I4P4T0_9MICO|nr:Rv3235 family protein [Agromyces seonyuensis]MWB99935.1 3-hydroxyacyl-CoA dehydrogenase [Agromyces seonyuensis]